MNRVHKWIAASTCAVFLLMPGILLADCPDGARPTTEAERQDYMRGLEALKAAVPPAPADWQLRSSRSEKSQAPTSVCKGPMISVQPHEVAYVSLEQERLNGQHQRELNNRLAALRKLPPEEQTQFNEFNRQGMQLSAQSGAARRNKDAAGADRLLTEAKQFYAKSRAIQQAHAEKIAPEVGVIEEERGRVGNPEVRARLTADRQPAAPESGAEKAEIPGAVTAFFDQRKALVVSLGRDSAGNNLQVRLEGDRERVLTIARLFADSKRRAGATR